MSKVIDRLIIKDSSTGVSSEYQMQDTLLKARVNNLVSNSGEQTEGNEELIDIRVGSDGKTYETAGEAVREQINSCSKITTAPQITLTSAKIWNFDTFVFQTALNGLKGNLILVVETDKLSPTIIARGVKNGVYNSNNTSLIKLETSTGKHFQYGIHNPLEDEDSVYFTSSTTSFEITSELNVYNNDLEIDEKSIDSLLFWYNTISFSVVNPVLLPSGVNSSPWDGKNAVFIGDSITHTGHYVAKLQQLISFQNCQKIATPGAGAVTMLNNVNKNSELVSSADLILVYGFVNDYYPNAPEIGSLYDESDISSYTARVKSLLKRCCELNPTATIIVVGTTNAWDSYRPQIYKPVKGTDTIAEYINATDKIAQYFGLRFINLYQKSGFNEFNFELYLPDKVHPSELGGNLIGEIIYNELNGISPR